MERVRKKERESLCKIIIEVILNVTGNRYKIVLQLNEKSATIIAPQNHYVFITIKLINF